jgi:hypothetical protein
MSRTRSIVFVSALVSLASCGGDSAPDDYQMAVDQANAKQAEAITLAPASPCQAVQQCANLALIAPEGRCPAPGYRAYSLASATASAASAAAADERSLAIHAISIAPPPIVACAATVIQPPGLACVSNTCQAAPPAN